mmetsp:Transcript_24792/g.53616  ORF Transcript_24792/g.53616 Transcript_24792/m.53616 type:complete len:236 (-) Transcript_24792:1450-2157(-)
MIPNHFLKEGFNGLGLGGAASMTSMPIGMPAGMPALGILPDYAVQLKLAGGNPIVPMHINPNIDSLLQVHRRKMQRRAANRRSAQLSRARKKAHLEELKIENARLQKFVDILDSQPELVFCVNPRGAVTYVAEKTMSFIKMQGEEEEPSHLKQILAPASVDLVLQTIQDLLNCETDASVFAAKEVHFTHVFGHPMAGFLRLSKVSRTVYEEEEEEEEPEPEAEAESGSGRAPPFS